MEVLVQSVVIELLSMMAVMEVATITLEKYASANLSIGLLFHC